MKINFFDKKCQSQTPRHKFGICDQPPPPETPAYLGLAEKVIEKYRSLNQ